MEIKYEYNYDVVVLGAGTAGATAAIAAADHGAKVLVVEQFGGAGGSSSLGLVTPPYGLCLLLASSISGTTIEEGFKGTLPYFLSSLLVLLLLVLFPDFWLAIPKAMFSGLF